MNSRKRTIWVAGYYLLTLLITTVLVYLIVPSRNLSTITITAHFKAQQPDTFSIYWPGSRGDYSESRAINKKYHTGENKIEFAIPVYSPNFSLRIDPLTKEGSIQIYSLTVGRVGFQNSFSATDLKGRLVNSIDVATEIKNDSFNLKTTAKDPQLYFSHLAPPIPPGQFFPITLFTLIGVNTLLLYSGRKLLIRPPHQPKIYLLLSPTILAILCYIYSWPLYVSLPTCCFLVFALQYNALALYSSGLKIPSEKQGLDLAFIILFLGLLFYPLWKTINPYGEFLSSIKTLGEDLHGADKKINNTTIGERWIKTVEDNLSRYFAYRDQLIHLNAGIKVFVLGFSPTQRLILGNNGMFFEGHGASRIEGNDIATFDNITDYMGLSPFSEKELEAWRICLEERFYWLKERGIDYVFVLAPAKAQIYEENLPDNILKIKHALNKPTRYDQLSQYLKENSIVPFVSLKEPLLAAKKSLLATNSLAETPLYYRTDFHWTYYGAYIAYHAIIEEIQKQYPHYSFAPEPLSDFTIKANPNWVHERFLYLVGLNPDKHRNETYLTFMPRAESIYASISDFGKKGIDDNSLPQPTNNNFNGYLTPTRELTNPSAKDNTIFVIGDSFSEKYFGFFSAHAKKTINFRTINSFFTAPYGKYQPNLVIQEILNMYLLQRPPGNSPSVRQARIDALAQMTKN